MDKELRVLLLEDDELDAELTERQLHKAGIAFVGRRAATRDDFIAGLAEFRPDLILADYSLPGFDGLSALKITREQAPTVPFIFVTGVMGEEFAIDTLHQGAADYVLKGHLSKLGPAVSRALQEAEDRRLRQGAEEALAESEERFRKIAESALDGLVIVNPDGAVTYWNSAAERMFGYGQAEMLGHDLHAMLAPRRYHDAFRHGWPGFAASGGGAVVGKTFETFALRKNGEEFPVELSISSVTIKGRWHAIGIVRDIAERKRAEATRTELAAIVESSTDAIIGKTLAGIVTSWNRGAEAMYGYTAEEMIGRPIAILSPPERVGEVDRFLVQLGNGLSIEHHETVRRRKDGSCIDVSLTLSPIRGEDGLPVGVSTIARDITQRKAAERALRRGNRFLRTLSRCNETLVRAASEEGLLGDMCRVVVEVGEFPLAWVGYAQQDAECTVRPVTWAGEHAGDYVASLHVSWADVDQGQGPTGTAIRTGQVQVTQDIEAAARMSPWRPLAKEYGYRSSIALPLRIDNQVIGVLNIYAGEVGAFGDEEVGLLTELAGDLAFGIATLRARAEQADSARRLEKSLEDTIGAIATTIEARDPYTAGHQRRVALLSAAIAREMGLPDAQVTGVKRGAEIHDIGKIYVPSEILSRPGRLSEIEFDLIKIHPQVGYDIIKDIEFPWPVAQMVLQHHERIDGKGYPAGLQGDQIIVEAKILAVADVVDAMVSHRPYRPALGLDAALAEIEKNRGLLYETAVADACVRVFRERGFEFK